MLSASKVKRLRASQNKLNLASFDADGDGVLDENEMEALEASKAQSVDKVVDNGTPPESTSHEDAEDNKEDKIVATELNLMAEPAEYAKKTALVLVVVFCGKSPWLTYVLLIVFYIFYFLARIGSMSLEENADSIKACSSVSKILQIMGEILFVVFSFYFILYREQEYGWFYWVIKIVVGGVNGLALLATASCAIFCAALACIPN